MQKPIDDFSWRSDSQSFRSDCKQCGNKHSAKYYQKNKEKIDAKNRQYDKQHEDAIRLYNFLKRLSDIDNVRKNDRERYQKNIEKERERRSRYRKESPERFAQSSKKYRETHKEQINAYFRNRKKNDLDFKIKCLLRDRLNQAMKNNQKSGSAIADLGMSIENFKIYLEERFCANPDTSEMMGWENYGMFGWHIDHIIPLSAFDLTDREQLLKAVHYSNLRPMWAKQNLTEGDRGMSKNKKAI